MAQQKTTRDAIVAAATELLAEEGLLHFHIGRVTARVGISRRTFFNYFGDKDELLTEVLKTLRAAHERAMEEWSAELPDDLSADERIVRIFTRIIGNIGAPGWKGSAFIRLAGEVSEVGGHSVPQLVAAAKRDQERWFARELSRGRYESPERLATQLTIIMTGLFQLQLVHRAPYLGEAVLDMLPRLLAAGSSLPV